MAIVAGVDRILDPTFQVDDDASSIRTALPPYTSRSGSSSAGEGSLSSYVFHLRNGKGRPWATLKVKRALGSASSVRNLPIFVEGLPIVGSFSVDLEAPNPVRSVELIITGNITTAAHCNDRLRFLDHRVCLWSDSTSCATPLQGKHKWPFSVHLPREIVAMVSTQDGLIASGLERTRVPQPRLFRLPHTLMDRDSPVGVNYYIAIKVSRRRFHADSKLATMISFYSATRPDPPSLLRQQSYKENQPILGPEIDSAGWQRCDPVKCRGRVFDDRMVEVECTLFVTKPLCFTRGTAIPLFLSIASHDRQALDLLRSPSWIKVQLRRHIRHTLDISGGSAPRKAVVTECGDALWWPTQQEPSSTWTEDAACNDRRMSSRTFAGELRLSKFLQPSCETPYLAITYTLSLQPFQRMAGFHPEDASAFNESALVEVPVSIATLPAKGPPARCYSPPSYSEARDRARKPGLWQATHAMMW